MPVKNILVVDDSPTERFFTVDLLTKAGYQVTTAENGEEGIAKAKATKPDLILMDVVMPGLNGYQATRTLTRDDETKAIPIIVCTSKGQETDQDLGFAPGGDRLPGQAAESGGVVATYRGVAITRWHAKPVCVIFRSTWQRALSQAAKGKGCSILAGGRGGRRGMAGRSVRWRRDRSGLANDAGTADAGRGLSESPIFAAIFTLSAIFRRISRWADHRRRTPTPACC